MITLFLILTVIGLSEGEDSNWCEWGNYTYFISDQSDLSLKLNYTKASVYCQNLSAHLASVHSLKETEFLMENAATSDSAWIGLLHTQPSVPTDCNCLEGCPEAEEPTSPECLNCVSCRGADKWQWEDGTEYDWTNWASDQPSDFTNEMCARLFGGGKWYDTPCSHSHYFICKKGLNCYPDFCNSHGECKGHVCVCHSGYTGASCGSPLTTGTVNTSADSNQTPSSEITDKPPTAAPQRSDDKDSNMGAIIGGAAAAAVVLVIAVVVGIIALKCRKKKAWHDYVNTEPFGDEEKSPQGEKSVPMGNGISADYADADVDDINFYAASDVAKKSKDDNQYSVEMQNDLYDRSGNQPEVEDGPPVYAEVDKDQKKKNRNKPTKPPRTNRKKKGQAPPPPVNDQGGAVYAVPDKGKKAQKKEGSGQVVQGETNLAMLYAEPKKKSKQNVGQPVVSSAAPDEVEYEDVQKKETRGKPQPMAKPRKK